MPNGSVVLAPTSGVIEAVSIIDGLVIVALYIRGPHDPVEDDHTVYAPVSGALSHTTHQGRMEALARFVADPDKKGSLLLAFVDPGRPPRAGVLVIIEVGSGYVTNEVELAPGMEEDGVMVQAGQQVADIVLRPHNSRAYVVIDTTQHGKVHPLRKAGDIVQGGVTPLLFVVPK